MVKRIFDAITKPQIRIGYLIKCGVTDKIGDEKFLKKVFRLRMGYDLNLTNPQTFNEKLQWLKLYDRNPEYTIMVDKYKVRYYIEKLLGKEYLIPLLGVWNTAEEIDFTNLPDKFVLKCNHNSGLGMCICTNKSELNIKKVKKELKKGLRENYYLSGREWPYKNVERKIIAETYLCDDLWDYKFFCFNGQVDSVMVCIGRQTGNTKFYFFDREWRLKRYNIRGKNAPADFTLPKPRQIDRMFNVAETLSKGIPFVRIDLYCVQDKIYFGEMTFFPDSGFDTNLLEETDRYWGKKLILPTKMETESIDNKN